MIKQSPLLSKHIRKRAADLYFPLNMGFIKALASNSNSLDGLDVHCGVIDELAAIKNRDLYDLIKQAMGARQQPILFALQQTASSVAAFLTPNTSMQIICYMDG